MRFEVGSAARREGGRGDPGGHGERFLRFELGGRDDRFRPDGDRSGLGLLDFYGRGDGRGLRRSLGTVLPGVAQILQGTLMAAFGGREVALEALPDFGVFVDPEGVGEVVIAFLLVKVIECFGFDPAGAEEAPLGFDELFGEEFLFGIGRGVGREDFGFDFGEFVG